MSSKEKWFQQWTQLETPKEQGKFLQQLPEDLKDDKDIQAIQAGWNCRYFYTDKRKRNIGDRFVWLYLAMRGQGTNQVGQKEIDRIYREALLTDNAVIAFAGNPKFMAESLKEAAASYSPTLREVPPILGIIPQKDKSAAHTNNRVAITIIEGHLHPLWVVAAKLDHSQLVAQTLVNAVLEDYPRIASNFKATIEELPDGEFKNWINQLDIQSE